ncbi:MAG TPA: hypothetical protein VI636_05045 [Candidatus Angelobacter sp.]
MRTTLNIDDDVLTAAKQDAERRSVGLGRAVSDLARRGMSVSRSTRIVNGVHVVDLPADSPRVTFKKVRELDAEQG